MAEQTIGSTQTFVLAKGFTQVGSHAALISEDDTRRLFAELYADPDRPEVRPQEGLDILHQGLTLAIQEYPLPFVRRTELEFVLPGDEGIAWWEGLSGLCTGFGLRVRYLDQAAVEGLTRWVLNPNLEYHHA